MGRKIISGTQGKMSRVFIDGNEFCAEDWTIQEVGDEEDVTNTCSGGASEFDYGVTHLEGEINYTWDVANNPWNDPPNFRTGSDHPNTKLYVHATAGEGLEDGPFWGFTLTVTNHSNSLPVKGKVTGTVSFKSKGAFTVPTGNDSSGG